MKIRLADYVADFLVENGIVDCFTVVGGGAMHLNDAFGHKEGLHCTYNHHEQGSAIAAEAYARLSNRIAALCVTTGPGGTNALTGVVGGWLDSIPMLIISGQVRYDTTARYCDSYAGGFHLRSVGDQEFDITRAVGSMCKYAVMLEEPNLIRHHLEKALKLAKTGRPGPVWIDIPVNFQGCIIETDELISYNENEQDETGVNPCCSKNQEMPEPVTGVQIDFVLEKIKNAKRPVLYAGNGIRLSGGYDVFCDVVDMLGIPVCTYWDSIDLIETEHPLYVGRAGNMGDRPGNFAVQNADVILAIGNRLPIRVTGYNWKTWAREAYVIMVDIDQAELKKPCIHVEMPIHADAKDFLEKLKATLLDAGYEDESFYRAGNTEYDWLEVCQNWKKNYPVVQEKHWQDKKANAYATFDYLSKKLPSGTLTITSNGTCCVAGHQSWNIKKNSRFFNNNAIASMGYGLPAAIGGCLAKYRELVEVGGKLTSKEYETICLEGDGSIMMNLQELQTIVTNNLPIKIFLINNAGYHSIRQTQTNLFSEHSKVGIGPESKDLSFPNYKKIANAFGIPYMCAETNDEMMEMVDRALEMDSYVIVEIYVSTEQFFEPKNSAKRMPDGSMFSAPLEDLAPFLPREEFLQNMYIQPLE